MPSSVIRKANSPTEAANALRQYSRNHLLVLSYHSRFQRKGRLRRFYNSAGPESEVVHVAIPQIPGGLMVSLVGIINGAINAIAPQVLALLATLGVASPV